MEKAYKYYLIDDYNIVVRKKDGIYERYTKDGEWVEDTRMVGIMTGHIPFFTVLTESRAKELIGVS